MRKAIVRLILAFIFSIIVVGCGNAPVPTPTQSMTTDTPIESISTSPTPSPEVEKSKLKSIPGAMILANGKYVTGGYTGAVIHGPVIIKSNPDAHDPTWAEVISFIYTDNTDSHPYYPDNYVCADYAAQFYENAQNRGLKCGFVVLDGVDHGINAFNTTDKGLIYIDYTGKQYNPKWTYNGVLNYKKIAYIKEGSVLGVISFDTVISNNLGFDYPTFVTWKIKADAFEAEVSAFSSDVSNFNVFVKDRIFAAQSPDLEKAETWQQKLKDQRAKLIEEDKLIGPVWDLTKMGIVTGTEVFWKGYGE
jgi:hypothetical protein